jgi:hypothetical protein
MTVAVQLRTQESPWTCTVSRVNPVDLPLCAEVAIEELGVRQARSRKRFGDHVDCPGMAQTPAFPTHSLLGGSLLGLTSHGVV